MIDQDLFLLLCQQSDRERFREVLILNYFPNAQSVTVSSTWHLNVIAEQILKESTLQYKKRIKQLEEKENKEWFEEEIYIRNIVFKKKIPQIYNHTCCITGLKIESNYGHSLIDACHIIPFHLEHDDTIGNGITLCPNLHRAFDYGLLTINTDYRVVVSRKFTESPESSHSIRQFDSKALILPENKLFFPRKEVIQWHNENVFEKKL